MKHFILTLAFICLSSMSALAQSTRVVKGAVVDKNGNPLPGAVVEATGGAESAVVDADGTYAIEVPIWLNSLTAKYAGMRTKKMKLNTPGDVVFRMKAQRKGSWFVSVVGAVDFCAEEVKYGYDDDLGNVGRIGLMGGYIGKWGGYVRVTPSWGGGSDVCGVPSVTAGVIKSIVGPVYAYVGLGYAPVAGIEDASYSYWSDYYKQYIYHYKYYSDYESGMMVDVGLIFKIKKIVANVGYSYSNSFCCYSNHDLHFGVGYCF